MRTVSGTDKGRTLAGVLPRPGGEGGVIGAALAVRPTIAPTAVSSLDGGRFGWDICPLLPRTIVRGSLQWNPLATIMALEDRQKYLGQPSSGVLPSSLSRTNDSLCTAR
jgi:hypothetical protein